MNFLIKPEQHRAASRYYYLLHRSIQRIAVAARRLANNKTVLCLILMNIHLCPMRSVPVQREREREKGKKEKGRREGGRGGGISGRVAFFAFRSRRNGQPRFLIGKSGKENEKIKSPRISPAARLPLNVRPLVFHSDGMYILPGV